MTVVILCPYSKSRAKMKKGSVKPAVAGHRSLPDKRTVGASAILYEGVRGPIKRMSLTIIVDDHDS